MQDHLAGVAAKRRNHLLVARAASKLQVRQPPLPTGPVSNHRSRLWPASQGWHPRATIDTTSQDVDAHNHEPNCANFPGGLLMLQLDGTGKLLRPPAPTAPRPLVGRPTTAQNAPTKARPHLRTDKASAPRPKTEAQPEQMLAELTPEIRTQLGDQGRASIARPPTSEQLRRWECR